MNFFTSVFSEPPGSDSHSDSVNAHPNESHGRDSDPSGTGAWELGGLWRTLSVKSESIIETYRRDLEEFGSGLKKEIEVAHGSLEAVGHIVDHLGNTVVKGTAHIISHGKDAILLNSDSDSVKNNSGTEQTSKPKRYCRFDSQVRAIQGDVSTYSEVPEDLDEFDTWKLGFSLEGKSEEMEGLLRESEAMESVYKRVVPNAVDRDTFWYRVYKFKKDEDVRARLVRRMSRQDLEEELSWDVEEEDDDDDTNGTKKLNMEEMHKSGEEKRGHKKDEYVEESKPDKVVGEMGDGNRNDAEKKVIMVEDGKDSHSPVASKHSANEEDLEWDEIEDLGRIHEKKTTPTGSPTNVYLREHLSVAQEQEEEEDLSWDIEDDYESAKA
ncbi:BSD domain-containing protein 1, partial [Mucuna pruriens]